MNRFFPLVVFVGLSFSILRACSAIAQEPQTTLPRSFVHLNDIEEPTYGHLEFRSHPLKPLGAAEGLPAKMDLGCFVPRKDGAFDVYGWTNFDDEGEWAETNPQRIIRLRTTDGMRFTNAETVLSDDTQRWLGYCNIVRRPTDGQLFCFAWSRGHPAQALHVFTSDDGTTWNRQPQPAYTDHDACFFFWHQPSAGFVNFQNTYQRWNKRFPDNIGDSLRRVLSIRTSVDGVLWHPDLDVGYQGPHRQVGELIVPDKDDPAELEFYRSVLFPAHGRTVGLLLKYAPSPQFGNTRTGTLHGPGLGIEWFWCNDELRPQRTHRQTEALPSETPWMPRHAPFHHDGWFRFYNPVTGEVVGIEDDRIFSVWCQANAEFCSPTFTAPSSDLVLNAKADRHDSYIMAEVITPNGTTVAGFERQHCVHKGIDQRNLVLNWNERSISQLSGQPIRIRLLSRNADVFQIDRLKPDH